MRALEGKFLDAIDHKDADIAKSIVGTYTWSIYRGTKKEDETCPEGKCYVEFRLTWDLSNKLTTGELMHSPFWETLVRDGKGDRWKIGPNHISKPTKGTVMTSACAELSKGKKLPK